MIRAGRKKKPSFFVRYVQTRRPIQNIQHAEVGASHGLKAAKSNNSARPVTTGRRQQHTPNIPISGLVETTDYQGTKPKQ